LLSATAFVVLGFAALTASSAAAAPAAGTAEVVTPQDGTSSAGKTLANGSGKTRFSLKLPAGAACSGDSTNGGYRVQSFMVPRGRSRSGAARLSVSHCSP
jgi:hypothetical protein